MDYSILYDLITDKTIYKWKDEFKKLDDSGLYKNLIDFESKFFAQLSDSQKKLAKRYRISIEDYLEYIYCCVDIKLLYLAINLGMQLQKAFNEYPNK